MADGANGGMPAAALNAFAMPAAPGDVRGGMMQMPLWGFPCGPIPGPGHIHGGDSPMTQGFVVMQQGHGQNVMQQVAAQAVGGCASTPWGTEGQDTGGMDSAGHPRLYSRGGC